MPFHETCFAIPKMDCPSEEQMIRMALDSATGIENLSFDLGERTLTVVHAEEPQSLLKRLTPLGYGAAIKTSRKIENLDGLGDPESQKDEAKVLWILSFLNAGMFLLEMALGVYSQSAGLIADGLDMLADASVYGISLYAVGKTVAHKHRAARLSGYFQLILAVGLFAEVVRRFVYGSEPIGGIMSAVSVAALLVNVCCLVLLNKHRGGEVHMKASWIFSANDVIANVGVILAGILVMLTGSRFPDLIIGTLISLVVLSGAIRILKMARN